MIRADMHVHTYCSDGSQSPSQVIDAALRRKVGLVAITDHDNMNACEQFKNLAAQAKITAVDGIEISAYSDVKVHILGYNVDYNCREYAEYYRQNVECAEARTRDILKKLKKRGINLTMEEVIRERVCNRSPIHSTYIARAAARKGYGKSPWDFYLGFLAAGKCGYSALGRPSPEEAVKTIARCGGISSLAHPGRITLSKEKQLELIDSLISYGLNGIEAVYSGHTDSDTAYYKEIAADKKLLVTGGSDTHFAEGNREVGVPEFYPSDNLLSALKVI